MRSYAKWKERSNISVTNLLLDPLNPRLPVADKSLSQAELIEELVQKDDVYPLAKSIIEQGYFPGEPLIVIEDRGKKWVIEGNRRIAALKLLLSPVAAPSAYQSRFKSLADGIDPTVLSKVRILIAPDRSAAAPIIMVRHTQTQIKKWSTIQQAKFFRQQVDAGVTIDQLVNQYVITPDRMRQLLRSYVLYDIACHLKFEDEISAKVNDPRKFPITTLDRVCCEPEVQKFLGIEFDDNLSLKGKVKASEFKKGYTKIVDDIASKKISSRVVNTKEDAKKYLSSFGEKAPNLKMRGRFTDASLTGRKGARADTPTKKPPKKRSRPPKSASLIPKGMRCTVETQRIYDVFMELKRLKVDRFPNAVAILLRTLLEMSVHNYLYKSGQLKVMITERKSADKNTPRRWSPKLSEMLSFVVNETPKDMMNPLAMRVVEKLVKERDKVVSSDSLNFFVHNQFYTPTEERLRALWNELEELFKVTLHEPQSH